MGVGLDQDDETARGASARWKKRLKFLSSTTLITRSRTSMNKMYISCSISQTWIFITIALYPEFVKLRPIAIRQREPEGRHESENEPWCSADVSGPHWKRSVFWRFDCVPPHSCAYTL